jgi:hypothetical protein
MQRQFRLMNPPHQKFTKTDLGKFVNSWDQRPNLVSLGAEKNFREFMLQLDDSGSHIPEQADFERIIAQAILFRTTEKFVSTQKFGGYRANIVTYTIAKLVHATAHRIDLATIWRTQTLSAALSAALVDLSHPVNDVIVNPRGRSNHVGEWTKKLDCWKVVEELNWPIPANLEVELIGLASQVKDVNSERGQLLSEEEAELVNYAAGVPAQAWFAVSNWAKETGNLQSWQRSLAYSLGVLTSQSRRPSVKQARQGRKLLEEATRLGFALPQPT